MDNPKKSDPFSALWTQAKAETRNELAAKRPPTALELTSKDYLQKAKTGPRGGITADALQQQLGKLKKVTEVNTPFAPNLTIKRDGDHTAHSNHSFADFVVSTRRDLSQLGQTNSGQDLFKAIASNATHKVRIQDAGSQDGIRQTAALDSMQNATRSTGKLLGADFDFPNVGSGSTISHHPDITQRWATINAQTGQSLKQRNNNIGLPSSLGLGHELVHAARAVTGWIAPNQPGANVHPEERETVGTADGKRSLQHVPTENELRRDLNTQVFSGGGIVTNVGKRTKYGGHDL